jgi:hypothetical protein
MTPHYTIVANGSHTGILYHGNERVDGIDLVARDDGGIGDGGLIDWGVVADDGDAIWHFLRDSAKDAEMRQNLATNSTPDFDVYAIIDEEGMGYEDVGPVECLVVSDGGMLGDGSAFERADLSSADAFRAQVRRWKDAVSGGTQVGDNG